MQTLFFYHPFCCIEYGTQLFSVNRVGSFTRHCYGDKSARGPIYVIGKIKGRHLYPEKGDIYNPLISLLLLLLMFTLLYYRITKQIDNTYLNFTHIQYTHITQETEHCIDFKNNYITK